MGIFFLFRRLCTYPQHSENNAKKWRTWYRRGKAESLIVCMRKIYPFMSGTDLFFRFHRILCGIILSASV